MGSIIASLLGWILGKVFGLVKQNQTEKKYVESMKENFELRAQNAGLWKRKKLEDEEDRVQKEWEASDEDRKYKILERDFSDTD